MTLYDERLELAREIAEHVLERYGDNVRAIALEGSMANGPSAVDHRSDIDMVVVAREPTRIPEREVFLGDVLISMGVTSEQALLEEASELRWDFAIASEGFVGSKPLYDPDRFFEALRRRHEETVDRTSDMERSEHARAVLMGAFEYVGKGERALERGSLAAASVCLIEALITVALSVGLFTGTRWRGSELAVAAVAGADWPIDGFADAFREAIDYDNGISRRLAAAARVCDILRAHYDSLGARSDVGSVRELFG